MTTSKKQIEADYTDEVPYEGEPDLDMAVEHRGPQDVLVQDVLDDEEGAQ